MTNLNFFSKKGFQKIVLTFSVGVSLTLLLLNNSDISRMQASDSDSFFAAFSHFQKLGYYDGCVAGYGLLYNSFLTLFFNLTHSYEQSFFLVNLLSQLAILIILIKTLFFYINKIDRFYFFGIAILVTTQVANLKAYSVAYNDTFLAVFVASIIYVLITKIFFDFENKMNFIALGALLALALSIRETTAIIILCIFLMIILLKFTQKIVWQLVFKNITYMTIVFLFVTVLLHFPSLKENKKLCFYDKNPKTGAVWIQRNYLGLKKIQNHVVLPIHRDAIWINTRFEEVNTYLKTNGEKSLPKNIFEVILKDPLLLAQIFVYNFGYLLLISVRFYGLLLFSMLFLFLRKSVVKTHNLMLIFTIALYILLSFICVTFVETRWLTGYEFLIPASTFMFYKSISSNHNKNSANLVLMVSLIMVSGFNLLSINKLIN